MERDRSQLAAERARWQENAPAPDFISAALAIDLALPWETPIHVAKDALVKPFWRSVYSRCSRAKLKFYVDDPESALTLRHYFSGASQFAATDTHPRSRARTIN